MEYELYEELLEAEMDALEFKPSAPVIPEFDENDVIPY